jgi:mannose-6-phosphate isomerase
VSRLTSDEYTGKPEGEKISEPGYDSTLLIKCNYFTVTEYDIHDVCDITAGGNSFQSLLFLEGEGDIAYKDGEVPFKRGDTFFIPADMGEYSIHGKTKVLLTIK